MPPRQRVPSGPPTPPPVQRVRLRYAKRGRMRFSSSRDFQRALERALRRAEVPMAYSAGFHPHPKISYTNTVPTGVASDAEYVELGLAERVDPRALMGVLTDALPDGMEILDAVEAGPGALADRLEASRWSIVFAGVRCHDLNAALHEFLALTECSVTRVLKSGPRTFDVRAAVLAVDCTEAPGQDCAILTMVVRNTTPTVRPDDVLTALRARTSLIWPTSPLVTRLAQGPLVATEVADPLAIDRDVTGT